MSPRSRRLISDLRQMEDLAGFGQVRFTGEGNPPELYTVELEAAGLELEDGWITARNEHRFDAYLHRDYPRRPPVVVWQTPVFHPNLLGPERNGGVCIGSWGASESLADLVRRLIDLVTWRSINPDDALDRDAAEWVTENSIHSGVEISQLVGRAITPLSGVSGKGS